MIKCYLKNILKSVVPKVSYSSGDGVLSGMSTAPQVVSMLKGKIDGNPPLI